MKLAAAVNKSIRESIRDWKMLAMVLVFSPFFLLLMSFFYGGDAVTYKLGVLNLDAGRASVQLISSLEQMQGQDEGRSPVFDVISFSSRNELQAKVKDKEIEIGLVIPADYSAALASKAKGENVSAAQVSFYGSMGNVRYSVAAVWAAEQVNR